MAKGLGLSSTIIKRAKEILGTAAESESDLIEDLNKKRQEAEQAVKDAEILRNRAAEQERVWRAELDRFRKEKRELLSSAKDDFDKKLKEREAELNRAISDLQKKPTLKSAEIVRKRFGEIKRKAPDVPKAEEERKFEPIEDWSTVFPGQQVWVESLGQRGILLSIPDSKGLVEVQVGVVRTRVPAEQVSKVEQGKTPSTGKTTFDIEESAATSLHIRGMRAEDAMSQVESFIDAAVASGHTQVVIVHGHGTGKLRNLVREYLSKSPLVSSHRPGEPNEGGNGVTVVMLAS